MRLTQKKLSTHPLLEKMGFEPGTSNFPAQRPPDWAITALCSATCNYTFWENPQQEKAGNRSAVSEPDLLPYLSFYFQRLFAKGSSQTWNPPLATARLTGLHGGAVFRSFLLAIWSFNSKATSYFASAVLMMPVSSLSDPVGFSFQKYTNMFLTDTDTSSAKGGWKSGAVGAEWGDASVCLCHFRVSTVEGCLQRPVRSTEAGEEAHSVLSLSSSRLQLSLTRMWVDKCEELMLMGHGREVAPGLLCTAPTAQWLILSISTCICGQVVSTKYGMLPKFYRPSLETGLGSEGLDYHFIKRPKHHCTNECLRWSKMCSKRREPGWKLPSDHQGVFEYDSHSLDLFKIKPLFTVLNDQLSFPVLYVKILEEVKNKCAHCQVKSLLITTITTK